MHRTVIAASLLLSVALPASGQERSRSREIRPVQGARGVTAVRGVGQRRNLPHEFEFRANDAGGRRFEHSFDLTTNAQFAAHNTDDPAARLRTESLYNNPWYWQNLGSLDTELMTGGSGVAAMGAGSDGDYYNPYFYDQWKSSDGGRHGGALTNEIGRGERGRGGRGDREDDRRAGPAELPGTTEAAYRPDEDPRVPGQLAAHRTALSADRLGTAMRESVDDSVSGRTSRELGRATTAEGRPIRYMGSSLQGLATLPAVPGAIDRGLTSYDLAQVRDDKMTGRATPPIGQTWNTAFRDLASRSTQARDTQVRDTQVGSQAAHVPVAPDLTNVYESMADRFGSLSPGSMSLSDRLDALDRSYRTMRGGVIAGYGTLPPGTLPEDLGLEDSGLKDSGLEDSGLADGTATEPADGQAATAQPGAASRPLDVAPVLSHDDFGLILRHGQRVESLAAGDGSRFDDVVSSAQQRLGMGDYLRSERRFGRALRFVPGHPLATAGLGHAQLGASLYLSSALTLETLLAFQPEMIDVQYADHLLPAEDDMNRAISILNDRIQQGIDLDRYGFLLAYIGHQLDRPSLVATGLAAMRQGAADESFVGMLEEVWSPPVDLDDAGE